MCSAGHSAHQKQQHLAGAMLLQLCSPAALPCSSPAWPAPAPQACHSSWLQVAGSVPCLEPACLFLYRSAYTLLAAPCQVFASALLLLSLGHRVQGLHECAECHWPGVSTPCWAAAWTGRVGWGLEPPAHLTQPPKVMSRSFPRLQ